MMRDRSEKDIEVEDDKYEILYSPGTIFSGQVPAFDINFISKYSKKQFISYHNTNNKHLDFEQF